MSAPTEPEPTLEFVYGLLYACDRCKTANAVRAQKDVYGDYFSCLMCGMTAEPDQLNAVFVEPPISP